MLVSDLDHTMVQNEDKGHQHLLGFGRQWVSGLGLSSALIYATGRSPALYKAIWVSACKRHANACKQHALTQLTNGSAQLEGTL